MSLSLFNQFLFLVSIYILDYSDYFEIDDHWLTLWIVFLSWRQVYLSALSLYVERLWICEVDIKTFVLVQSYNRFFVLIIKWGKLILRFVLITLALLLGFQVIFVNVTFHSCRGSGLFFWEDFRAYYYPDFFLVSILSWISVSHDQDLLPHSF